jgi:hypothetical protein
MRDHDCVISDVDVAALAERKTRDQYAAWLAYRSGTGERPPCPEGLPDPTFDVAEAKIYWSEGAGAFRHRWDGPAVLFSSGRHDWWLSQGDYLYLLDHNATTNPVSSLVMDAAWAIPDITIEQVESLYRRAGESSDPVLALWLTRVLLSNPSPHLSLSWRVLAATTT